MQSQMAKPRTAYTFKPDLSYWAKEEKLSSLMAQKYTQKRGWGWAVVFKYAVLGV